MSWVCECGCMLCAGIMVCGKTVAEAFDAMYYLEQVPSMCFYSCCA